MNLQEIVNKIQEISLQNEYINSFNVGNTWNQSASKSSDVYPACWLELPVLINYAQPKVQKRYEMSLDVLMLAKQDDLMDELNKISQCEQIADEIIKILEFKVQGFKLANATGLTVKAINADLACGVRIDFTIITNRENRNGC